LDFGDGRYYGMEVHGNDGNMAACFLAVILKPNITLSNAIWEKMMERKY